MSILIKKAKIIQPGGAFHLETKDILIEKGQITKIANTISSETSKKIEGNALHVSIGLMDIGVHSGEPGFEHRETIQSLKDVAASGAYTAIAVFPNTSPVMDNSTALQWFKDNDGHPVQAYPIGALSVGTKGKDLAELLDMNAAGAVAFSDGIKSIDDNGLLMRALQYVKSIKGLIIHHPNDHQICSSGEMHEGAVSTSLGLTGIPTMAELSHVERDLSLLEYTDSSLLIHLISSKDSVNTIKRIRNKSKLFCSVSYMNLLHTDDALRFFDSNYKLSPPLRTSGDQKALLKAVEDDNIDLICTNHFPLEEELKKDAFPITEAGAIGLQSCLPALCEKFNDDAGLSMLVEKMAQNPRTILGLPVPKIAKGEMANLAIFDLENEWTYDKKSNKSLSENCPFLNQKFQTKVIGIVRGKTMRLNP